MRRSVAFLWLTLLVLLFTAASCSDDDSSGDSDSTEEADSGPEEISPYPAFLLDRPELLDWSYWYTRYDHADPVPFRRLGGVGMGNGKAFGMIANFAPLTTLRNHTGPHYQKYLRFFSDQGLALFQGERFVDWDTESCYRVRGTAVYVTHQQRGDLSLWVVDFAPQGGQLAEWSADRALVRQIIVYNSGAETIPALALVADSTLGRVEGEVIRELILEDHRSLAAGFPLVESPEKGKRSLTVRIGDLAPGEEWTTRYQVAYAAEADPVAPYLATAALDIDYLLDETLATWKEFTDEGARIVTSNPRFDDLMEGLSVGIATQQAELGGVSQMSEYSGTWLRDIYGSAMFYPLVGRFEDYRRMLDYYWVAALVRGGIGNSMDLDVDPEELPAQPDWESMPTFSGRTSAESPSYLILHYQKYVDATGDWSPVEERYGMLRTALLRQDVREDCLLPFSDDETFRPAMMVAFGHDVFDGYQDKYLSANSSFLFVVAAEFMARAARELGYTDDAAEYDDWAARVRECTEEYYWLDDGYYAPIIDINTLQPVERPYEDVNTMPVWTGYLDPDDPQAASNLTAMLQRLDTEGGLYYSPLHPMYLTLARILGFEKGVVTGMVYGYQLANFARVDHPAAEDSFLMYERFFHTTGHVSEGHVIDDFGRIVYLTEPFGFLCDLTARYRTWEGGIDGAAMIDYLFGLEQDATAGRIALAPHLPAGWPEARMERARLGDTRFDVAVEDDGLVRRLTVSGATGDLVVDAAISLAEGIADVTVNGEAAEPVIDNPWDRTRATLTGLAAGPDADLVIEVTRGAM